MTFNNIYKNINIKYLTNLKYYLSLFYNHTIFITKEDFQNPIQSF